VDARVKWPNDVVAEGRKLGGVLLESRQAPGGVVESVVVGIGINVNLAPADLPRGLSSSATSLSALTGRAVSAPEVLRAVLARYDEDWRLFAARGLEPFRARWAALSVTLGRPVEVAQGAGTVRGMAVDLSPAGALVVETADGRRVEVWHGDATLGGAAGGDAVSPGGPA